VPGLTTITREAIDMHARPFLGRTLAPLALASVCALAPASAASASSGPKCTESRQYGSSCIELTGSGLRLQDVQGYFSPPNRDYLTHHRWALALTRYPCNPIHRTRAQCSPTKRWLTRVRHGNPPQQGTLCNVFTPGGVGFTQCVNYGIAYAAASHGDWQGFYRMAHQFHRNTWFCSELVVRVHRRWRPNGAAGSVGVRGCAEVHD
jgi:hypothetical protein